MDLEAIMVSKIGQNKNDKYCMTSLICRIYKSQTHKSRGWNGVCQGLGDGGNGEILVKGYKLPFTVEDR